MVMVDVDDSSLLADSQPKSIGLVWGLAATGTQSPFIKWTLAMALRHDHNTINIVVELLLLILLLLLLLLLYTKVS